MIGSPGSSVRSVPPQHGGFHPGQRAQFTESEDHPPPRQAHFRSAHVRTNTGKGSFNGAANPHPPSGQGVRLPCRRRVHQVKKNVNPSAAARWQARPALDSNPIDGDL